MFLYIIITYSNDYLSLVAVIVALEERALVVREGNASGPRIYSL